MRQMRVSKDGRSISLTPHELRTINYLVTNCGRVVTPEELIEHVHGTGDAVTANAVEALIGRMRRKLGPS